MKDPAFLFYSSDFLSGTLTMTDEQVGKYIRLLCLQHQKGRLTEKDMLFICKSYDEDIFSKFEKDNDLKYFNVRLEGEITRRKDYSESRSKNRMKKITYVKDMNDISKSYVKHMETETITKTKKKKETILKPELEEIISYFKENNYTEISAVKFFKYYSETKWKDSKGNPVLNWKAKAQAVWFKPENEIKVEEDVIAEVKRRLNLK
jgi:hypothetical protein